ncbi:hypothetical protein AOQ84DRAFT_367785 [Glonium stellatum]|uniref:Uncharacterized protein n=1 Tax=Glonium stellatum TaxID=574774 RepID=A0A8E2JNT1_9PEZI|nr:hypothetical protein AOQ84DRAFT_367785 [Glonium stellatum]
MPNYRNITIALRSQYDISAIPEFHPPESELSDTPFSSNTSHASSALKAVDNMASTVSTYIPIYPSSQFWICYEISPPVPLAAYFFFKLLINGAHVVSWSCGREDGWRGKTMFGLFETPENEEGKKFVERRSLFFGDVRESVGNGPTGFMEIRVHRSNGRKRIARQLEEFEKTVHPKHGRGIELVNAGRAKKENPKRFYKLSLIDPIDQPFVIFKYYYCTQEKLEELGILGRQNDNDDSTLSGLSSTTTECSTSQKQNREEIDDIGEANNSQPKHEDNGTPTPATHGHSVPFPALDTHLGNCKSPYERNITETPKHFYRLSIPPSLKLVPSAASSRLVSPEKLTPNASMVSLVNLPSSEVEWLQRTPSPVKSARTEPQSPLLGNRKRTSSIVALKNVVASALRRRSMTSPDLVSSLSSRNTS